MKSARHVAIGKKKKENGDRFESQIKTTFERCGWVVLPIPNGCKWIGPKRIIAVATPFDFVATKNGKALFFDAKSKEKGNFCYSDVNLAQVECLEMIERTEHTAGYVVFLKERQSVFFFSARYIKSIKPGESLSFQKGILLGSIDSMNLDLIFNK